LKLHGRTCIHSLLRDLPMVVLTQPNNQVGVMIPSGGVIQLDA
jgi:hypothetical protein